MINLEKQLKKFPRFKIGSYASFKIKTRLRLYILKQKYGSVYLSFKAFSYKQAFASFLIVSLIFSTTSAYAYASQNVFPGHGLYFLRRGIEKTEYVLNFTTVKRSETLAKFSERRLGEAVILAETYHASSGSDKSVDQNMRMSTVLDEASQDIDDATDLANSVSEKISRDTLIEIIRNTKSNQSSNVKEILHVYEDSDDKEVVRSVKKVFEKFVGEDDFEENESDFNGEEKHEEGDRERKIDRSKMENDGDELRENAEKIRENILRTDNIFQKEKNEIEEKLKVKNETEELKEILSEKENTEEKKVDDEMEEKAESKDKYYEIYQEKKEIEVNSQEMKTFDKASEEKDQEDSDIEDEKYDEEDE